jgi:hypothetical protein
MAAAKTNGATSEATDTTAMVSGSVGSGVAMAEVGPSPGSGSGPEPDGPRSRPDLGRVQGAGLAWCRIGLKKQWESYCVKADGPSRQRSKPGAS